MRQLIYVFTVLVIFNLTCFSQTPTVETEKVFTEEIKVNVSAFDRDGKFVSDVKNDDLVIMEDGRLHQANSVRLIAPSVLIALDTGGENRQTKNINTTREIAENLVNSLQAESNIALVQFHEKTEFLADWTTDKNQLLKIIESRTNFGRRSTFNTAIGAATDFFQKSPTENRHLILITDGLDSFNDTEAKSAAIKKLLASGIIVHVISYTQTEINALQTQAKIWRKGEGKSKRLPEEVKEALIAGFPANRVVARAIIENIYAPRLFSILIDFPFIKDKREKLNALAVSQLQLSILSEYTGGELLVPETIKEMIEKSTLIAQSINSQYVVTYTPKRPLKDSTTDETRQIEVSSRRADLQVKATRKLLVFANQSAK